MRRWAQHIVNQVNVKVQKRSDLCSPLGHDTITTAPRVLPDGASVLVCTAYMHLN